MQRNMTRRDMELCFAIFYMADKYKTSEGLGCLMFCYCEHPESTIPWRSSNVSSEGAPIDLSCLVYAMPCLI